MVTKQDLVKKLEFDFGFQYPNTKVKEEFLNECRKDRLNSKIRKGLTTDRFHDEEKFQNKYSLKLDIPGSDFQEAYK